MKNSIVKSDFSIVHKNHDQVKGQKFECSQEWMALFLNESDVMASASEKFGPALGKALAREWEVIGLPTHQTVATLQGRKAFLTDLIFSSEAANDLEMNQRVAKYNIPALINIGGA